MSSHMTPGQTCAGHACIGCTSPGLQHPVLPQEGAKHLLWHWVISQQEYRDSRIMLHYSGLGGPPPFTTNILVVITESDPGSNPRADQRSSYSASQVMKRAHQGVAHLMALHLTTNYQSVLELHTISFIASALNVSHSEDTCTYWA